MNGAVDRAEPAEPAQISIRVTSHWDSFGAGHQTAILARAIGFNRRCAGELAIVVSELVTNAVKFAGGGVVRISALPSGIAIEVEDEGPGIDDVDLALIEGYSEGRMLDQVVDIRSRRGLGAGLAAVVRLADEVEIINRPGGGTRVVVRKLLPTPPPLF